MIRDLNTGECLSREVSIRDKCIIESRTKYSEYVVDMRYLADYLRFLENRIDCLESKLQGDGK